MDRRHFIKLSTTSVVSLLLSRITYGRAAGEIVFNAPDEVWVEVGGKWLRLASTNASNYKLRDFQVAVKNNSVLVSSPVEALEAVRLKWKHATSATSKFLGDQWERSYGDLAWKSEMKDVRNPWYVVVADEKDTACFGVKTETNTLCWWGLGSDSLELTLDTRSGGNGVMLGDRTLHAASMVTTQNTGTETPYETLHRFCGIMCEKPRLPRQPVYGINDWYFAYGRNSFDLIRKTTAMMSELVTSDNRPFSVIDAGWAEYAPLLPGDGGWNEDFAKPNDKFKDMHLMADEIKRLGMRPGLWIRPLCARHNEKQSLLAPKIPGRDDPKASVLDPTIDENIERIKNYFSIYRQWGYDMVKHDYSTYDITGRWGINMKQSITSPGWNYRDRSKTTAEIILHLYRAMRTAAGENIYLIGCNTMSHLSAGLFELCRIGDDTSGNEWSRVTKMGVNTLAFRLPQHNKFYAADGDCVGLTTDIPWDRNRQWLQLLAESGSPLFISAQPEAIGEAQRAAIKTAFAQAATPQPLGEPIDWMTNVQPARWKLNGRIVDFDWG